MSILNAITNMFASKGSSSNELESVLSWVESQNGISGILEKMKQHGFGAMVESWLSDKENLSILPEQVLSFIDTPELDKLAKTCGIDLPSAAGLVAKYLPLLADGFSSSGTLSSGATGNFLAEGLSLLQGKMNN
ncbi:YidB family protein [Scandinavium goeteborgense]|uniref:DUF937 domain-containing protein n=1 Tax=Scandinavium goeteborgense TaxID=1851514 RepID=A0A4R6DQK1_SCAGO|nr:YidB family protein [Scandinavium goeteborgense]TDN46749.1 hypothetical protein EC847_1432 [Scandinavium goeteborgense]